MITDIMLTRLHDGDLPMFAVGDLDIGYVLNPGPPRTTEGSPVYEGLFWEELIGHQRFHVPLHIDTTTDVMAAEMEHWLRIPHMQNPDVRGTLYVIIRTRDRIPGKDLIIFNGALAFFPAPRGRAMGYGLPLDGEDPCDIVRHILDVGVAEDLQNKPPLVRELFERIDISAIRTRPLFTLEDLLEREYEWQQRTVPNARASERARVLLYQHLTPEQIADVEDRGYFICIGADEKTYKITTRAMHNVFLLDRKGRPRVEFCIVTRSPIPTYDLMLLQKFLLESSPEVFWREANRWDIDLDGTKKLAYTSRPDPIAAAIHRGLAAADRVAERERVRRAMPPLPRPRRDFPQLNQPRPIQEAL